MKPSEERHQGREEAKPHNLSFMRNILDFSSREINKLSHQNQEHDRAQERIRLALVQEKSQ